MWDADFEPKAKLSETARHRNPRAISLLACWAVVILTGAVFEVCYRWKITRNPGIAAIVALAILCLTALVFHAIKPRIFGAGGETKGGAEDIAPRRRHKR
jgi:hypothetical protein